MVDADPHNPGGEGSAPGGRLRLINLVVLQVVELNRQRSILLSALHYSSDLTKTNYSAFYTVFLEVYKLTQTLISDDLNKELNNWVIASTSGDTKISKSDLRRKGLELADKLVDELSELGLLQLFEEQVAPPFLFDFDLLDAKAKILSADTTTRLQVEKAIAQLPVPMPIPVAALVPPKSKKKKRDK